MVRRVRSMDSGGIVRGAARVRGYGPHGTGQDQYQQNGKEAAHGIHRPSIPPAHERFKRLQAREPTS